MDEIPDVPVEQLTRDQRRSRRKRETRADTINVKRMTKRELDAGARLYPGRPGIDYHRPRTRGECEDGERPCPYVSCKFNLYLDVNPDNGSIKLNFPDIEPGEMKESCALDVADREGTALETVGDIMNMTRERIRQIEAASLAQLRATLTDDLRGMTIDRIHDPSVDDGDLDMFAYEPSYDVDEAA